MKTGGFKWWHGVIIVAAAAAVAWGTFRTFTGSGESVQFANSVLFVDVTTGDLFAFDISGRRAVVVPETNPETGKPNLLGVEKRQDGKWYIRERHLPRLADIRDETAAVADAKTGEVKVARETPRPGRP